MRRTRTLGVQLYKLLEALPAKSRVIWILRHIEGQAVVPEQGKVVSRRIAY